MCILLVRFILHSLSMKNIQNPLLMSKNRGSIRSSEVQEMRHRNANNDYNVCNVLCNHWHITQILLITEHWLKIFCGCSIL